MRKIFFNSFYIAGFTYYEGAYVFDKLKIGSILEIKPDIKNKHDEFAVEILFEGKKLGYIPREFNREVAIILRAGYDIFEAVVQQLNQEKNPELQVKVGLFVKTNKDDIDLPYFDEDIIIYDEIRESESENLEDDFYPEIDDDENNENYDEPEIP